MTERLRVLNGTCWPIIPKARELGKPWQKLRPKLRYETRDLELCLAMGIGAEQLASFELIAQISGLSVGSFSEVSRECDPVEADEKLVSCYPEPPWDESCCVMKKGRLLQILAQAVNELPASERLVLSLHYFEELTVKEISTILRMPEWKVLQLHTKAMLRLRTRLRSYSDLHELTITRNGGN